MSFEISINEKHKYKDTVSKKVATGNTGGNTEITNSVTSIDYSGTTLVLQQYGLDDLEAELPSSVTNTVRYDINNQGLDSVEMANARINIDVYSRNEIDTITGNLNDLNTIDKSNLVVGINQANSWKEISW